MADRNQDVPTVSAGNARLMNGVIAEIQVKLYWIGTIAAIAVAWGIWITRALSGSEDQPDGTHFRTPSRNTIAFWVAVGITLIAPVWTLARTRRATRLGRIGREAIGTVVGVGRFSKVGLVPVTVMFDVEGQTFTTRQDMLDKSLLEEGSKVRVLYDPNNPKTCKVFELTNMTEAQR